MPTSALATTSQSQDCSRTEQAAREWVVTFAELYYVSLSDRGPRFVSLWVSALSDLPLAVLNAACQKAMKTCKFFPTPAEIRALVDHAGQEAEELEAEQAWDFALNYAVRWYHPDLPNWRRNAPELPPRIEHAIRAAGDFHWLHTCPQDQLPWAKKAFISALSNLNELERTHELLPSGSEAKQILRQLVAGPKPVPQRTLASLAGSSPTESDTPDDSIRTEFARLRAKLDAPTPTAEPMGEEEFARRKAFLRRQAESLGVGSTTEVGASA